MLKSSRGGPGSKCSRRDSILFQKINGWFEWNFCKICVLFGMNKKRVTFVEKVEIYGIKHKRYKKDDVRHTKSRFS
jgi:hypothetical protein